MPDLPDDENAPVATPEAEVDDRAFPGLPITRLLFERRRIVYESGDVDVEEWDGEDWVAVDDGE